MRKDAQHLIPGDVFKYVGTKLRVKQVFVNYDAYKVLVYVITIDGPLRGRPYELDFLLTHAIEVEDSPDLIAAREVQKALDWVRAELSPEDSQEVVLFKLETYVNDMKTKGAVDV